MYSYAVLLGLLDAYEQVCITGDENGSGNGAVSGQRHHVPDQKGIDPLLLAAARPLVNESQPQLRILALGQPTLLASRPTIGAVVPIHAKQRQIGDFLGFRRNPPNRSVAIQEQLLARQLLANHRPTTGGQNVSGINECGDSIHLIDVLRQNCPHEEKKGGSRKSPLHHRWPRQSKARGRHPRTARLTSGIRTDSITRSPTMSSMFPRSGPMRRGH